MNEYCFNQLNELAFTTQVNTDTTGLVSETQLELMAILNIRIECHRYCYVISRQLHVRIYVQLKNNCTHNSRNCTRLCLVQLLDCYLYNYSLIARKYMRLPI